MAMTKAERAAFEDLQRQSDTLKAQLRLPYEVVPLSDTEGEGWCQNPHSGEVTNGIFNGNSHARNKAYPSSRSQGSGGPWYATKADALKAMRNEVALACFNRLRLLDERINEIVD